MRMVYGNKARSEKEKVSECLTDVVVFPHVAHRHVAHQEHSNSADAALLHVYVLVVVSVMAWNAKAQKYINVRTTDGQS